MKFLHTGDLHIGKIVNDFSMLEDQRHILQEIVGIAKTEAVDAVVIAGDVYDRSIPSTDAVNLLDHFLTQLMEEGIRVLMISGNHDSPERVGFANKILEKQGLYIGGSIEGGLTRVEFEDASRTVTFLLLPFVKPAAQGAGNSQEAVEKLLSENGFEKGWRETLPKDNRYVLVTHFFVAGNGGRLPELSDSETLLYVGGLDQVAAETFDGFDYVALGHIHKPQKMGKGACYYAGSPLKYSFSECDQVKGVNLVTIGETTEVRKVELKPRREMRKIKGTLNALIQPEIVESAPKEDYIQATLTDKEELIDPIGVLRSVYPNVMQIQLEKDEPHDGDMYETKSNVKGKSTLELFHEFYELVKGETLDTRREKIVRESLEQAGEEDLL